MKSKAQARFGDVGEVKTPRGFGYFQMTHETKDMGQLIRVLPGLYPARPSALCHLVGQRQLYYVFFPFTLALRSKLIEVVTNCPIPELARDFPIMRKEAGSDRSGEVRHWIIGHGLKLYTLEDMQAALICKTLTKEQKKISIAEIWGLPALIKNIARGWTPELDDELNAKARAEAEEARPSAEPTSPARTEHFLYFGKRSHANKAALQLELQGWETTVKPGADGESWLLLAREPTANSEIEDPQEKLERLAQQFNGEYDGRGTPI